MIRARFPNAFLWLLLGAALFMRAFVPQGYMAERTDAGTIEVKVCGSGHIVQIPLGKRDAPDAGQRSEPPCTFAGLGTAVLPPPVGEVPVPARTEVAFVAVLAVGQQIAVPLPHPPARGPPPTA